MKEPLRSRVLSPDGKYLIVISYDAPLGTIFDAKLETQKLLQLGKGADEHGLASRRRHPANGEP
jgi:hypothetical protein